MPTTTLPIATDTIIIEQPTVSCDGGNGALGHPRVFLHVGPEGSIDCPYCGRHFVLDKDAPAAAAHG
jgi:uncharacterized Zn-finger protein